MRADLLDGCSPGTNGTVSESGWSNSEIFMEYLQNNFLKLVPGQNQKILLLLDGHKSHITVQVIEWAQQHNIILQLLPAHTSHFLQPLDVGCFGPFQNIYNNICHKTMSTKHCVITRYDVCKIACRAYSSCLSQQNLQSAFRKTGIYPYNRDIIDDSLLKPSEVFNSCVLNDEREKETDVDQVDVPERRNETELDQAERGNEREIGVAERRNEREISLAKRGDERVASPAENGDEDEDIENVEGVLEKVNELDENFFSGKIDLIRKIKSEKKGKQRNVLSRIVSGRAVTEHDIADKVKEHVSKQGGKKGTGKKGCTKSDKMVCKTGCNTKEKKKGSESKRKCTVEYKELEKGKKARMVHDNSDSQRPGPSAIYVEDSEIETDDDSEIKDEEKCCVCEKFTPENVRHSASLIFVKWAECISCGHWVHLIYCTQVRVVRKGDIFLCKHCTDDK